MAAPLQPPLFNCYPVELLRATEEQWEERTLNLLRDSTIDQEFSLSKARKEGGAKRKKHKLKWMRRPMAIPDVLLECFDRELREEAIRALSNFLVEGFVDPNRGESRVLKKRKEDPENYNRTGFLVFYSCGTMPILLQELLDFSLMMADGMLTIRSIRRVANVLTLFQSVAANSETRQKFVESQIPMFLLPMICFTSTIELFDNARAVAISIIGILCQGRDTMVIKWALDNEMIHVCCKVLDIGNELSKVIALHILESILRSESGICFVCKCSNDNILVKMIESLNDLVMFLANDQDYSPRLLYHVVRCYVLLCTHPRGLEVVALSLPKEITEECFHETFQEFPVIKDLVNQLEMILMCQPCQWSSKTMQLTTPYHVEAETIKPQEGTTEQSGAVVLEIVGTRPSQAPT